VNQAVVFASTQNDTDLLAEELAEMGHQVVSLHGAMPQAVRNRRIRTLREGRARVLVATDVAARGLDVPSISHVINFGLPMKNEDYVHRIGRTGRAGRSGQAITLATHRERSKVRSLEDYLKTRIAVSEIAGLEPSPPPEGARRPSGRGGYAGAGAGRRRPEGERNFRSEGGRSDSGRPSESRGGEGRSFRDAMRSAQSVTAHRVTAMIIVVTAPMPRVANNHAVTVHGRVMVHRVMHLLRRAVTIAATISAVTVHQHRARRVSTVKRTAVLISAHVVTIKPRCTTSSICCTCCCSSRAQ
jgi:superfamily II DNA/RNA helicase